MARPSKFDRNTAVETVMNEMWLNGYEASSVKSLSEKLGITRSSFYNAFGSREALFLEALSLYGSQSPDRVFSETTPQIPVKKIFTEVFRTVCAVRLADPQKRGCMAINSVAELCKSESELATILKTFVEERRDNIEALLNHGVRTNEIDKGTDTHTLALVLQNTLVGLNIISQTIEDEQDLWASAKMTLRSVNMFFEAKGN